MIYKKNKIKYSVILFLGISLFVFQAKNNVEIAPKMKTTKSWESICERSKKSVIQILTFAKSPNILEPFRSPERLSWCGSGFFIKMDDGEEGYILSNFHVVEKQEICFMLLPALSKERFLLDVIGCCPEKDLALLRLNKNDCKTIKDLLKVERLPCLEFGDSDALVEGETIMVLGYPLGMENFKSSKGIVSGRESSRIGETIQTTAAVNPGNSGGPVVDKKGKVIGVSTMKQVATDTEGVAFLIPTNNIKPLLLQLKNKILVRMPFWDIDINPTTDHQRACINAPSDGGVYVKKVFKKSLFEKATVQRGDILYQVNGFIIDRFGYLDAQWGIGRIELIDYLNRLNIGTEVSFSIYRNGECKKLCVIVQEPDPFKIMQIHSPYEKLPYYEVIGGFVVSELTVNHLFTFFDKFGDSLNPANENVALFARYAAADNRHKNRLIISAVLPDSPGDKTRCFTKSFDRIIDTVNNESVSTIEDFHNAVRKSIGKESLIITTEGGTTVTLSVADIVAAENSLQRRNEFYPQSPLIDELAKAVP